MDTQLDGRTDAAARAAAEMLQEENGAPIEIEPGAGLAPDAVPVAHVSPEVAQWLDPAGTLQDAGLMKADAARPAFVIEDRFGRTMARLDADGKRIAPDAGAEEESAPVVASDIEDAADPETEEDAGPETSIDAAEVEAYEIAEIGEYHKSKAAPVLFPARPPKQF